MTGFSSATYWDARYRGGGASGPGSEGRLARFKAAFVNRFILDNKIASLVDLGCGDGAQLGRLTPPADYTGVDVSPTALARCQARFPDRRFVPWDRIGTVAPAELTLSLDVLYHLTEDAVFADMLDRLFRLASRFVVIYASNTDATWPAPHVRHRAFTGHPAAKQPGWRLLAHLPNPCPFEPARALETSFADFFVYGRAGVPCALHIPAVE